MMILVNNTTRKSITNTIFVPLYDTKLYAITRSEKSVNIQVLSRATVHCSQQSTQKLKKAQTNQ